MTCFLTWCYCYTFHMFHCHGVLPCFCLPLFNISCLPVQSCTHPLHRPWQARLFVSLSFGIAPKRPREILRAFCHAFASCLCKLWTHPLLDFPFACVRIPFGYENQKTKNWCCVRQTEAKQPVASDSAFAADSTCFCLTSTN